MLYIKINELLLPAMLSYQNGRHREVAMFANDKFIARGGFAEVEPALSSRNRGSVGWHINRGDKVEFAIDMPGYLTPYDGADLTFTGSKVDLKGFRAWRQQAAIETMLVRIRKGDFASAADVCKYSSLTGPSDESDLFWGEGVPDIEAKLEAASALFEPEEG